jgi:hypothetical protein
MHYILFIQNPIWSQVKYLSNLRGWGKGSAKLHRTRGFELPLKK